MQRIAMVINVKPEKLAEYKRLHAAAWPEVLDALRRAHVRNYSIFLKDHTLFGYLEYHGSDWDADMAQVAADPATKRWWALTDPCQEPWPTRTAGEWWARMQSVFLME
jgi:L-rhamnose mutarotase